MDALEAWLDLLQPIHRRRVKVSEDTNTGTWLESARKTEVVPPVEVAEELPDVSDVEIVELSEEERGE